MKLDSSTCKQLLADYCKNNKDKVYPLIDEDTRQCIESPHAAITWKWFTSKSYWKRAFKGKRKNGETLRVFSTGYGDIHGVIISDPEDTQILSTEIKQGDVDIFLGELHGEEIVASYL